MRPVQVTYGIQTAASLPNREAFLPSSLPALTLVGALLLTTLLFGVALRTAGANLGRPIDYSSDLNLGIDPNTAQWFELAQLPGIGESLARKIVAFRESARRPPEFQRSIF
jgi:hypothetical protein